jgi:RHS repeat-associated protein
MMTIERIQAWRASEAAACDVTLERGLPCVARVGAAVSRYAWAAGELTEIVEPDGQRFTYGYGADGRLLTVDKDGRRWADYSYDGAGRLTGVARPDGPRQHDYDERGRLVRTRRGNAGPVCYAWQGERVGSARSDREQSYFEHDARGRIVGLEQSVDGVLVCVRFEFDDHGRLARIAFPGWRHDLGFEWDGQGRPAAVRWNGALVSRFGSNDDVRLTWSEGSDGVREETWHEPGSGRPVRKQILHHGKLLWSAEIERDDAFRVLREGGRSYAYDGAGRLCEASDGARRWSYRQDVLDRPLAADASPLDLERDAAGRLRLVRRGTSERIYRHDDAGNLLEVLHAGRRVARCVYDHKGRLVKKTGPNGVERYVYGADDGLLAVADDSGAPLLLFLRLPTGVVALIDLRHDRRGSAICLHADMNGNLLFAPPPHEPLAGDALPCACDPYGVPERQPAVVPYLYRGRVWHAELGLYRIGCRWYDPVLRQFTSPDTYTGAPDDERLVNPFRGAGEQRMARAQVLSDWLRQPRLRNRVAYCMNDPINRFDPNGHWSFGGVLLSLLGVLWTLPNTAFGLAVEVSCLLGEIVRWLVWLFSGGNVSWQTPGFDVAASGRLNAFALVFKGGWLGSFESLLGITFGNVIFVNGEYEQHPAFQALPDPVSIPASNGSQTIPKRQALYEHELRHVSQYGWFGPFFHLGLPLFGVYEWDVILNGYQNARLERDARDHGGF